MKKVCKLERLIPVIIITIVILIIMKSFPQKRDKRGMEPGRPAGGGSLSSTGEQLGSPLPCRGRDGRTLVPGCE